jgi:hypothetical protein
LRAVLADSLAGDPMGRRRPRTHRRLRQIAHALADFGLSVSANTVRRLLDQLGIALRGNRKELSSGSGPQRDRQFRYIARQRRRFIRKAQPIISVDSKKKELVGCFKNPGRAWSAQPMRVKDHDFRSEALGMAIPYGIYDPHANRGSVYVGTTHDTPQFAVESIGRWWHRQGKSLYGADSHLLILADGGGSNGYRCRAWKWALQERLVDPCRLPVTVCHYPTGASKWNPVEHRLFSEISKHWAGIPLQDYPLILKLIGETTTTTGLTVKSHLICKNFPTGVKISDEQMRHLRLRKTRVLPQWNYTLLPRQNPN